MTKGILIQAFGHNNYYQMAVVIAASIKANEPDMPICLVTDNTIHIAHAKLFDSIILPIKESIINKGVTEYIKAKLFMYDYSPFDETIFLDVDQIIIKGRKLSTVFDELKNIDITFSNTGIAIESIWANIDEVKELYGNKPFSNLFTSRKVKKLKTILILLKWFMRRTKLSLLSSLQMVPWQMSSPSNALR